MINEAPAVGKDEAISVIPTFHFRDLLERLPVGAYACDPEGLITYANPQAIALWGREPRLNDPTDRYCGSLKMFAIDGTPIPHDQSWMALAIRLETEFNGRELVIERPDGRRATVLAHARPVYDDSGRLAGGVNVVTDITDRKSAEVTRATLAAIVESSDDAIISKKLDGTIVSWNEGAERIFGYTDEEAVGQPITIIIPPERREEERSILSRLWRGERIDHYETVRTTKDGRLLDISLSSSPVYDGDGRIVGVSKVARDITERKQSQRALAQMKTELASQLDDLRRLQELSVQLFSTRELKPLLEGILRTATGVEDTDMGLLSLWDPEAGQLRLGASLGFDDEFLALCDRVSPGEAACGKAAAELRRVIVENTDSDPLFDGFREAGRRAGIRAVHSTPLITREGRLVGVLSTHFRQPHRPSASEMHLADLCARQAVDFIENARLYQELLEADRAKNEFLAVLAHELRNPLAPIRNAARILQCEPGAPEETRTAASIIERQIGQMTRLIDDLLDIARITGNKLELRRQPVALADILRNAVETSRPLIESRGQRLAISEAPDAAFVNGDLTRLAQVVSNLLNNASKFTPAGGRISLSAFRQGSDAVIRVKDTGIGIPRARLGGIFEMFAQGDHQPDRVRDGLGIGLTLAKRLVDMHGGSVRADSEGRDKGSEFEIRLPMLLTLPESSVSKLDRDPPPLASGLKILVVEDNLDSAITLQTLLRLAGNDVHCAHDGLTALAMAEEFRPDVVVLDIGLPGMGGHAVARQLRRHPWGRDLALVAMTGWSLDEDRKRSQEAGFDHHLVKPVEPETLMRLIASLGKRRNNSMNSA